jgi:hypothetical protein
MTGTVTGEGDKDWGVDTLDIQFQETVDGKLLASPLPSARLPSSFIPNLQIPPPLAPTPHSTATTTTTFPQAISPPCLSSLPPSLGVQVLLALPILPPPLAAPPPSPSHLANSSQHVGRAA